LLSEFKIEALKFSDTHEQQLLLPHYCGIGNLKSVALLLIPQERFSRKGSSWMFDRLRVPNIKLDGIENR